MTAEQKTIRNLRAMKENAISLQRQIDAMLASFALPVEKVKKENKYVERQKKYLRR